MQCPRGEQQRRQQQQQQQQQQIVAAAVEALQLTGVAVAIPAAHGMARKPPRAVRGGVAWREAAGADGADDTTAGMAEQ